jgi:hypothetical protein
MIYHQQTVQYVLPAINAVLNIRRIMVNDLSNKSTVRNEHLKGYSLKLDKEGKTRECNMSKLFVGMDLHSGNTYIRIIEKGSLKRVFEKRVKNNLK